jgi:hypothetical protein
VPLPEAADEVRRVLAEYAPPVLDPFCGGGSIPLEAQRLGLGAHASDLNPVAVLITKALVEIPPIFAGQPPVNPQSHARDDAGAASAARRAALAQQLEQAQTYLLKGYIREDQFVAERTKIERELATLLLPQDTVDLDAVARLLRDLGTLWRDSTEEERRDIARACFERVWVDLDARPWWPCK